MAKPFVTVEEYLRLSFDGPDHEYLDGAVVERNLGTTTHSSAQVGLIIALQQLEEEAKLFALPGLRMKLSETRYRVADLAAYEGGLPDEEYPSTPPFIAAEVVSPEDRFGEVIEKLDEYRCWGVRHIWLADPFQQKLFVYGASGLNEVEFLEAPEYRLQIRVSDLAR